MTPDYKNWLPRGLIYTVFASGSILAGGGALLGKLSPSRSCRRIAAPIVGFTGGLLLLVGGWLTYMYRVFSFDSGRQLARKIVDGVAEMVTLPEGGVGLDVGCGSGALTIACAKNNPQGEFIGIDRWGLEYASFSKNLCEQNAIAEGVSNVRFQKGNAVHLDFDDETFDAVTSNLVYHNIPCRDRQKLLWETLRVLKKGGCFALHDIFSRGNYGDMDAFLQKLRDNGYSDVKLIDTTDGMFLTRTEALTMCMSGSALLVGRK